MRVLLVGPLPRLGARNNLPWLRYTASALRRLGHDVAIGVYRESWAASPTLRHGTARLPGAARLLERSTAAMAARRDRLVVATARRFRPQLTIVLKGEVFSGEVFADLRRLTDGPLVTWWVDDPWAYPDSVRLFPLFDRVFIFDRSYMSDLAAKGISHTSFLPCACDETVYLPVTLSAREHGQLDTDVSFVASYYPQRASLVLALADHLQVGVWGIGWQPAAARGELGDRPVLRGGIVSDRQAVKIYNACKMGLNLHHTQSRLAGLNTRTFELLASGTLPLVDRIEGMEELLEPGRELACYRSPEEACEVAQSFVADRSRRLEIVRRGRERVLREHTYLARMRALCRQMAG